jgi:hypothetical protein
MCIHVGEIFTRKMQARIKVLRWKHVKFVIESKQEAAEQQGID